ncbi:alkaline phosphatase family protein [Roseospira marina]|uniref:Alkaline phosphatase family protein n=1 Tax=Roseospira marina TaxID=140057 RepID=A0A5M6IFP5_9PROT|nr:alkaline phosphatase family protein [Roseospira marina]KAA5607120.1 alkaline phosphatase family protein [Roseospira marina]MBB4312684.1 putative AlkP superfamily pyrophosphatase or phosphodiesterase [Roseospira marina]MBB5086543.1 putative AlkP superfamily pyrophosphatase or phosphodiesterase [Roseospira marina]
MTSHEAGKVILVVIDGLGLTTAVREMGFLEGLVAAGAARRRTVTSVLPSLSRPAYESIMTGLAPADHGITSNYVIRRSEFRSIFTEARAAGRVTAAVAFSWFAELANGLPFDPVDDRELDDGPGPIQHGRFYLMTPFPDPEVYWMAERMVRRCAPDLLLVHPMACDYVGHESGGESVPYRRAAALSDDLLAQRVPGWREAGYRVIVTADHGMCADGFHGGTEPAVREVPFYLIDPPEGVDWSDDTPPADQRAVAPTVLRLMGLDPAPSMTAPSLI